MSENNNKILGSVLSHLIFKNPKIIIPLIIILMVVGSMIYATFLFSAFSGQQGMRDEDKELYYTKCTEGELNREEFVKMFENAGVFTGKANAFISVSSQNAIDPVLLAAIAFHETGKGTSKMVKERNNPGGLYNSSQGKFFEYSSLEEGLFAMASNLNRLYISQGLVSIVQIGNKYAPIGVANDPTNLNIHWVPNVSALANQFGGLSMNCSQANMGSGEFVHPVPTGSVTSEFGTRVDPITGIAGAFHKGIDFRCNAGDPIYAASGGSVAKAVFHGWGGGYGHHVVLNHGDKYTLYGHMTTLYVKDGDVVEQGQVVGSCGTTGSSTGNHLHFEVQLGYFSNHVNPREYLGDIK